MHKIAMPATWPAPSLQVPQHRQPVPFAPQRFRPRLLAAPKPFPARLRIGAATRARPAANFAGAIAEGSEEIALRAIDQVNALQGGRALPLFQRHAARKAAYATGQMSSPSAGAPQARSRSRDAFASEFCSKPGQEKRQEKRCFPWKGSGAPTDASKRSPHPQKNLRKRRKHSAARRAPLSPPVPAWGGSAKGALASRRSTAASRQAARLDSAPGRASWNRRMQTGGPSPAPVQRAPRGPATRRTG